MKKIFFLFVVIIIVATGMGLTWSGKNFVVLGVKENSTNTASEIMHIKPILSLTKTEPLLHLQGIGKNVETAQVLQYNYVDLKEKDLERYLAASKLTVWQNQWIEKSNQGTLDQKGANDLVLEMRRQAVLNQLLAKRKLDSMKRKYL